MSRGQDSYDSTSLLGDSRSESTGTFVMLEEDGGLADGEKEDGDHSDGEIGWDQGRTRMPARKTRTRRSSSGTSVPTNTGSGGLPRGGSPLDLRGLGARIAVFVADMKHRAKHRSSRGAATPLRLRLRRRSVLTNHGGDSQGKIVAAPPTPLPLAQKLDRNRQMLRRGGRRNAAELLLCQIFITSANQTRMRHP